MEQLFLFGEEPSVIINEGGLDISEVPEMDFVSKNPKFKKYQRGIKTKKIKQLRQLPPEKYIAYPTGALHSIKEYHDLGPIFPYILNVSKGTHLSIRVSRNQYPALAISIDKGIQLDYNAHEIFAIAFVENPHPDILWMVDHKNDDKLNYQVNNLSWVTQAYNQKKAVEASKNSTTKILSVGSHRIKYETGNAGEESCDYMI
jgi:hypothetical protein